MSKDIGRSSDVVAKPIDRAHKWPGRRGCYHPRPPQTRTCRIPASGSSRESFAECEADEHSYRSYRHSVTRRMSRSRRHTWAAIHCRFVDRFAGSMSPPPFPGNGSLHAAPPFPLRGPSEPSSPALSGTTKALRLPIRVSMVAYLVCFHCPRVTSTFVLAAALPQDRRISSGPGRLVIRSPQVPALSYVDANGISQVSRRSVPCLCSIPRPRSNRCTLAIPVTSMLPPLPIRRRLRR